MTRRHGFWTSDAGADGLQSISITLDQYTIDGNAAVPVNADLTGPVAGPDGALVFSGQIVDDLDGIPGDETLDFTLTLRSDRTYVFDLEGGFGSSVTFSSADGSLDAGGPDPVRTLSFTDPATSIVFFGVDADTSTVDIFTAITIGETDRDEADLEGTPPAFLSTAQMNVSTSGIGLGNNNLNGDNTTGIQLGDESFIINPETPLSSMKVFVDNSVKSYDPDPGGDAEELYYTIYYIDGTTSADFGVGPTLVESSDLSLVTSGTATGGVSFEIVADAGKLIDAVQLTMGKGTIKIPIIEFTQDIGNVVDPVYIDFTATITDKDGDTDTSAFSVDLEADDDPQTEPDITLVDHEVRISDVNPQPDAFNVDLALGHDQWLIQGFDVGTDTLVLLNPLEAFGITPGIGDAVDLVTVGSTTITVDNGTDVISATDIEIAVADRIIDTFVVGPGAGGGGDDALIATGGGTLTGNGGADSFVFADPPDGGVTISDFSGTGTEGDRIVISASGFGLELEGEVLPAGNFASIAADADDYFIYNAGVLSFDADGNGAGAAVTLATLTGAPTLTAEDIFVIA
jgi:hypothetical protein